MTTKQTEKVAELMESTWSKTFYRKDHQSLVSALGTLMADCDVKDIVAIIKDYANNYDNAPNVATVARLAHMPKETKVTVANGHAPYFEDSDGCGYKWNEKEHDYDCVWKWWWAEQGKSKMATLKAAGVISY